MKLHIGSNCAIDRLGLQNPVAGDFLALHLALDVYQCLAALPHHVAPNMIDQYFCDFPRRLQMYWSNNVSRKKKATQRKSYKTKTSARSSRYADMANRALAEGARMPVSLGGLA